MSHTPGPWRVKEGLDRDTGEIATYVYGGLASIAECYGPDSIDNARLIVASPDMQKTLQEIANHHEEQRELWESEENADADQASYHKERRDFALAAVFKATGGEV